MDTIAVLGAGGWGTALAVHLGELGHPVRLWARSAALLADLRDRRANAVYLPDVIFPPTLEPTASLPEALQDAGIVVIVVPSHGLRDVLRQAVPALTPGAVLVSATKGLEEGTLLRMSQVVSEEAGAAHPVVALSGPSLAHEVGRRRPTALLVASSNAAAATRVQEEFRGPTFRLYASDDVVGVEVGGAMKNVIAIGAGVVDALGLGPNAMAALITRGLAEMSRLADALGGRRDTLAGLSGLGDLVLTCTSSLSRNHHVGVELGRGRRLADILAGMKMVAEGVRTTHAALALGRRHAVELPITQKMEEVLAGRTDPRTATLELMVRPQKFEREGAR
jgi:glycerol-3-phosphate dehydrogenase (NAD(P)+)